MPLVAKASDTNSSPILTGCTSLNIIVINNMLKKKKNLIIQWILRTCIQLWYIICNYKVFVKPGLNKRDNPIIRLKI